MPLLPREPPKTILSIVADQAASLIASENSRLGEPSETANKGSGKFSTYLKIPVLQNFSGTMQNTSKQS